MAVVLLPPLRRLVGVVVVSLMLLAGCAAEAGTEQARAEDPTTPDEAARSSDGNLDENADSGGSGPSGAPEVSQDDPAPPPVPSEDKPEPVPYVPAAVPGSADAYAELIRTLEAEVPTELRDQVPWPDLRTPNPIDAQVSIFKLWTWMAENHPEPLLVEVMTAPASPSREEVTGIFGRLDRENVLQRRTGSGYEAFDHLVVTFESAGLPLWLGRDVPEDAVVVYYRDRSDTMQVLDRDSRDVIETHPPVPTRAWLSIMVPTDVGWQLYRDQLIEPNDSELEVPDVPPPPGADEQRREPEV